MSREEKNCETFSLISICYLSYLLVLLPPLCDSESFSGLFLVGSRKLSLKAKLWPKCNLDCECTQVKSLSKNTIWQMSHTDLPYFNFWVKLIWCYGHFSDSIKITIFKTLRRLNTTWNFALSITRVSMHEHEHWERCLCAQSLLKRKFLNNSP